MLSEPPLVIAVSIIAVNNRYYLSFRATKCTQRLAQWPVSGLWVIGLFISIEMIFAGWSHIMIALAAKRVGRLEAIAGSMAT